MKFHQLTVGSRFTFSGKHCIKTNAVMASEVDSGKPVFMKRSSEVQPEEAVRVQQQAVDNQAQKLLNDALVSYRQSCLELIRQELPEAKEEWLSQLNNKLEQSRIQIFQQLAKQLG